MFYRVRPSKKKIAVNRSVLARIAGDLEEPFVQKTKLEW